MSDGIKFRRDKGPSTAKQEDSPHNGAAPKNVRGAAAAQIHRSLRAWQEPEAAAEEGESHGEPSNSAKLSAQLKTLERKVFRADDQRPAAGANGSKPAIPDETPETPDQTKAMQEAKAGGGEQIMAGQAMSDSPRLVAHYGPGEWQKFELKYRIPVPPNTKKKTVVIHFFKSASSGKTVEFKFKNRGT